MLGSSIWTSFLECPRKGRKEYRKKEKWKYHSWNGGYDAQQANCAPEELDKISRGRISNTKLCLRMLGKWEL